MSKYHKKDKLQFNLYIEKGTTDMPVLNPIDTYQLLY